MSPQEKANYCMPNTSKPSLERTPSSSPIHTSRSLRSTHLHYDILKLSADRSEEDYADAFPKEGVGTANLPHQLKFLHPRAGYRYWGPGISLS